MKKISMILLLLLMSFVLIACDDDETSLSFDVAETSISINEGETHQIDFTFVGINVSFEVSDESIITVDEKGVITAVSSGKTGVLMVPSDDQFDPVEVKVEVIEDVYIDLETNTFNLHVGEVASIDYQTNSHVTFISDDSEIVSIDNSGALKALKEGTTTLRVIANDDETVKKSIEVTVTKRIAIEGPTTLDMWVEQSKILDIESNDSLTYVSSDNDVVRVTQNGELTSQSKGEATITITSNYDPTVTHEISITVYESTEMIKLDGPTTINLGQTTPYSVIISPDEGYPYTEFESSDKSVASVDKNGNVIPHQKGTVDITAKSLFDGNDVTVEDTITIEIMHKMVVKSDAVENESYEFDSMTYEYGQTLFSSVEEALDNAHDEAIIYVLSGTYGGANINQKGIELHGIGNATFNGEVIVANDHISIEGFTFIDDASVKNDTTIEDFMFINNTVKDITHDVFMNFENVKSIIIDGNTFEDLNNALTLKSIKGNIQVFENTFNNLITALDFDLNDDAAIEIAWNLIDNASNAIIVEAVESVNGYARYNTVKNSDMYININPEHTLEFTLNYWDGTSNLDMNKFENVEETNLAGYYQSVNDIISRNNYHPDVPAEITILNPISEMIIGEKHHIELGFLPMSEAFTRIQFITSNPDVLRVNQDGELTPVGSGPVTITVRSRVDNSVNAILEIDVSTTPGIELTPSEVMNIMTPGDTMTLEAVAFPYDIRETNVLFESSDQSIATIDNDGNIETISTGVVTFKATLEDDDSVATEYTIEIYDQFDDDDLLDLMTMYSVNYTTAHRWTAYGFNFNYQDFRYESVSRFYFADDIENNERIVPVSHGIRPGENMTELPEGITSYNDDNVHWVVIHDTANTSEGAGALSHSNYLYNNAVQGNSLWVSWHYTIDDTQLYQHLPETERGYHAGDGSILPGESSTYLGGGNHNGIGIEMSPNIDGDMWRTWQRTAQLSADLLYRYNLPLDHVTYHQDFSGKICPQTLIRAGLIPTFEEMVEIEYIVRHNFSDATIEFETHNPEYIDEYGRLIAMPDRAVNASYTITVTEEGVERSRTFNVYLPGTIH